MKASNNRTDFSEPPPEGGLYLVTERAPFSGPYLGISLSDVCPELEHLMEGLVWYYA